MRASRWLPLVVCACALGAEARAAHGPHDLLGRHVGAVPGEGEQPAHLLARWNEESGALTEDAAGRLAAELVERAGELEPWPFDAAQSWAWAGMAARAGELLPRRHAARAVHEALAREPGSDPHERGPLERERLMLAWQAAVDAAQAFELDAAIAVQQELERRHRAPWSAMDLALSLGWAGRSEEAARVLAGALKPARAQETPRGLLGEIYEGLGLLRLGLGDEAGARDYLGHSLLLGSVNAAIVLARMDLQDGRRAAARDGFRAAFAHQDTSGWGLRGWGLAQLPSPSGAQERKIPR